MTINLLILAINLYLFITIVGIHKQKKKDFDQKINETLELLKPRILRDQLALREYCFICNGNNQQPAPFNNDVISVHSQCHERLKSGEVAIKMVSETLNNDRINLIGVEEHSINNSLQISLNNS